MAIIDYGVLLTKNNKSIGKGVFVNPLNTLGIEINDEEIKGLQGYLGDKDFFVCIHRYTLIFVIKGKEKIEYNLYDTGSKIVHNLKINGINIKIKLMSKLRYIIKFSYNNNHYKGYFGCGTDENMQNLIGEYYITKKEINRLKRENLL